MASGFCACYFSVYVGNRIFNSQTKEKMSAFLIEIDKLSQTKQRRKMSTSLSAFKGQLPSLTNLVKALVAVKEEVSQGAVCYLKMDKTGHFLYGSEGVEPSKQSEWAVNPYSFIHGYIAWGVDANVLGEKMTPMTDDLPEIGAAPEGAKGGWQKQMGFNLRCVSGPDEGVDAIYKSTAGGGLKALSELAFNVGLHINKDPENPIAIIALRSDFYMNKDKTVGRTYFPIFEVLDFIAIPEEGEEEPIVDEAPKQIAPAPRRARVAAPVVEEIEAEEVVEEAPAPRRRVRRG
jgi:hypothetical protein